MRDGVTTIVVFSFIIFGAIVGTSIGLSTWPDKQVQKYQAQLTARDARIGDLQAEVARLLEIEELAMEAVRAWRHGDDKYMVRLAEAVGGNK